MISQELLDILRCPMDPAREATLLQEEDRLLCSRCRLIFLVRDGFPVLVVEEAELPAGCGSLSQLPCQQESGPVSTPHP